MRLGLTILLAALAVTAPTWAEPQFDVRYYKVPKGAHPHEVAPAPDGSVWYTAQRQGAIGRLDPVTGKIEQIPLGEGSAPHGVIVGPDGGLNAIVRVDPQTKAVKMWKLPQDRGYTNLDTAAFDNDGVLWFTGQSGIHGQLNPQTGAMKVYDAPRGRGPYGIATTLSGEVYYASLARSHIARIDTNSGQAIVIEPSTPGQGARRVWADSKGHVRVSEWNAGNVSAYDPDAQTWQTWKLPGEKPRPYSIYVDEHDRVWLTDFAANAIVCFDPKFESFPSDQPNANVRQMLGRKGEVWGAESGVDRLVVVGAKQAQR
jgi:virginiamycin B lyase